MGYSGWERELKGLLGWWATPCCLQRTCAPASLRLPAWHEEGAASWTPTLLNLWPAEDGGGYDSDDSEAPPELEEAVASEGEDSSLPVRPRSAAPAPATAASSTAAPAAAAAVSPVRQAPPAATSMSPAALIAAVQPDDDDEDEPPPELTNDSSGGCCLLTPPCLGTALCLALLWLRLHCYCCAAAGRVGSFSFWAALACL